MKKVKKVHYIGEGVDSANPYEPSVKWTEGAEQESPFRNASRGRP